MELIIATTKNNLIGVGNKLPFRLKDDLRIFKEKTINCNVIMGRKTFESLPKPLPNRLNIVLTRNKDFKSNHENVIIINEWFDFLDLDVNIRNNKTFVIGGSEIFKQVLEKDWVTKIHSTLVNVELEGDTYFNFLDYIKNDSFNLKTYQHFNKDENNEYDFAISTYEKR